METPSEIKPLTAEQEAIYDKVIAEILQALEHSDQEKEELE
jgi:hypothetical protein